MAGGAAGEFLESTAADWVTSSFQIKPSADPSLMQENTKVDSSFLDTCCLTTLNKLLV